jgi:hypothetical protein
MLICIYWVRTNLRYNPLILILARLFIDEQYL